MHLFKFHDFVREARDAGKYTYISSAQVAAAFDNAPHRCLVETVQRLGVDPNLRRYIEVWLKQRIFRMRLTTSTGKYYSGWKNISKGAPQGGILSPFLWLLHINPFADRVKKALTRQRGERIARDVRVLLYADDITCALDNASLEMLSRMVWDMANASH